MGRWSYLPLGARMLARVLVPLFGLATTSDRRGFERLPRDQGYVLAPNHVSHLDPFMVGCALVEHGILPRFLGKDTVWSMPILGWIMRNADQIPVHRGTAGAVDSLHAAIASVREGRPVVIYPEGTLTRDPDQWPMSGRTGAVRVALETGKPLFPLMQWGPNEILAPYAKVPHLWPRKTVHMWVGEPLDLSEFAGRELTTEVLTAATNKLMDTLTAMVAQVRGRQPAGPRVEVRSLGKSKTNYEEHRHG